MIKNSALGFLCGVLVLSFSVNAQSENKECEMIASLTGDYFHHKQSGKSKEEVQQNLRPDFANAEFLRIADLAINLAYTFSNDMTEAQVEQQVFEGCEAHQR
jgi:hypothetical protein